MQEKLQIELDGNEEILAMGEKNQVMYICNTLLFVFLTLFFLYQSISVKLFSESFYFGILTIIFFLTSTLTIHSYKYNQIYLTNKKLIITQKDSINIIQYNEIKYIIWNLVYLKSNRTIFFAYTDLDNLTEQFKEIYPHFK